MFGGTPNTWFVTPTLPKSSVANEWLRDIKESMSSEEISEPSDWAKKRKSPACARRSNFVGGFKLSPGG